MLNVSQDIRTRHVPNFSVVLFRNMLNINLAKVINVIYSQQQQCAVRADHK